MGAVKSKVVARHPYCCVKERDAGPSALYPGGRLIAYDMWEWNVWKLKWVRLSTHGSGFGLLADADRAAKERSDEIETMLRSNVSPPPAL